MNQSFTFKNIANYITEHGHKIPTHFFQSSAFPIAIDFVNSTESTGQILITQGRRVTGKPILNFMKDCPEKPESREVTLIGLKHIDLEKLSNNLGPNGMCIVRKNRTPDHVGPIAGYLIKAYPEHTVDMSIAPSETIDGTSILRRIKTTVQKATQEHAEKKITFTPQETTKVQPFFFQECVKTAILAGATTIKMGKDTDSKQKDSLKDYISSLRPFFTNMRRSFPVVEVS